MLTRDLFEVVNLFVVNIAILYTDMQTM